MRTTMSVMALAALLAGCAATAPSSPPGGSVASVATPPPAAAPVAQGMAKPAAPDQADVLRAALGTWPQCHAEIIGFVGLASLAHELGAEGDVFADAIDDLSSRVADCIRDSGEDQALIWS